GEDLSWFWRGWFFTNSKLDQGVTGVKYVDDDPKKGALITLVNNDQMVLPVPLLIEQKNGTKDSLTLPVEIWQRGGEWTFSYPSTSEIEKVTIDPDHDYPDINPSNNTYEAAPLKPVPAGLTAIQVIDNYLKAAGGEDKIKAIQDFSSTAQGTVQGQEIERDMKYKSPDHLLLSISLPSLKRTMQKILVNGDSINLMAMGQPQKTNKESGERIKEQAQLFPELHFQDQGYKLSILPFMAELDGKDVYVVNITSLAGSELKEYFDAKTGLKVKKEVSSGNSASSVIYGDYKEVSGIQFPYSETLIQNGFTIPLKITDLKVNSGLTMDDFK
ncbi:MAG: hypothetical protein ABI359_10225, partial [Ginsengibacter sp.]